MSDRLSQTMRHLPALRQAETDLILPFNPSALRTMPRCLTLTSLFLCWSLCVGVSVALPAGQVAIFKDDIPAAGAPASPDVLSDVLNRAGFGAAFLNADQLKDPQQLNHQNFDVLVLPYGASFPLEAADNFRNFLRQGGKFFSTGGYAFDNLLVRTQSGWHPPPPPPPPEREIAGWRYPIPAAQLQAKGKLQFSGFLKTSEITGPGMAYFAVYQLAQDGSIVEWLDFHKATGTHDWKEVLHSFRANPKAAVVELRAGLYRCRGTAWFDDFKLTSEAGEAILTDGFESEFNPDTDAAGHWSRSDPKRCREQNQTRHAGERAIEVSLDFFEPKPVCLNTRHGQPGDGLDIGPNQFGVFDADYPLQRAVCARAAAGQCLVPPEVLLNGSLGGWAAAGVLRYDQARWIPLLNTFDRYGRPRGAAGALLRHTAGPYAGSSWAFFGVTNRDLFAPTNLEMAAVLTNTIRSLVEDTYFVSLETDQACYRQGEPISLHPKVCNGGRRTRELRLTVSILAGEPDAAGDLPSTSLCAELHTSLTLAPGQAQPLALNWKPARFDIDFYCLRGRLWDGDREVDRIESAFQVWNPRLVAHGPALRLHQNYLQIGARPTFLFGTDDWSETFTQLTETPLQWLRDMRLRRDLGVQIYENLQFGIPQPAQRETLLRKVDGITQLAQQHQQVYFPGLLIGANVAVADPELQRQAAYCREFAQRYSRTPGLIYYLNGDLRCELSEALTPQWNQFLKARYQTDDALRQAWGHNAPTQALGTIPVEDFNDRAFAWDDVKACDLNRFKAALIRRWSEGLIAGIREFDRAHPTTAEFYQLPHAGVDVPAGIDGLDLDNIGYFDKPGADIARFPAVFKYNDQRARGKSVSVGEYGVKTHPAWADGQDYGYHITRTPEQAIDLFLAIAHYSLGLGGSRVQNWCWKDSAQWVFPWGMVHACDQVPKDIAWVHRNQSLLFRQFTPVYQEPMVYVLTPDSHRLGGGKWQVIEGTLKCFDLALANHIDNLGTLNEDGLAIPESAKAIFYPIPFCPDDATDHKLRDWVRHGGTLYLSGDISYNEFRQRTRTDRLKELCGVELVAKRYPNIAVVTNNPADQPCIRVRPAGCGVLKTTTDGSPLLVLNQLGRGKVLFTPDPIELHSVAARRQVDLDLYRKVLTEAGVKPIGIVPDDPQVHVFRVPLEDHGSVYVFFNAATNCSSKTVTLTDHTSPVTLSIAPNRPALLWFDGHHRLRAAEVQTECRVSAAPVVQDQTGGIILSLDQKDLRHSGALLVMPLRPGPVRIATDRRWHAPTVFTGSLRNGQWWNHESTPLPLTPSSLDLEVSPDQVFSLLLITEPDQLAHWSDSIAHSFTAPQHTP